MSEGHPKSVFFSLGLIDILIEKGSTRMHKAAADQAFLKQLIGMLSNPKLHPEVSLPPLFSSASHTEF